MIDPKLGKANLAGIDLREANLTKAVLSDAKLNGADLRFADIRFRDARQELLDLPMVMKEGNIIIEHPRE